MENDGMRCLAVTISTRAKLLADGAAYAHPYLVEIRRDDGLTFGAAVLTATDLGELVREMDSPNIALLTGDGDDPDALRLIVGGASVH